MKRMHALLLASVCVLSACGGGGGDEVAVVTPPDTSAAPPAVGMVPASISDSVAGFFGYLLALTAVSEGNSEPLDVASVVPPLSEVAEPGTLP